MLASILTGTARTQALADFNEQVTIKGGLDKFSDKELRAILCKFATVNHKLCKADKVSLAESILTELPDRQKVESANIFELGQGQVIEQTADKLFACLTIKEGWGTATLKILDFFGTEMLKKGYKANTMRSIVTDLRNGFKHRMILKYGECFNRKIGGFEISDNDVQLKANGIYNDIVNRLEGFYQVEVQQYLETQTKTLKEKNQQTTIVDFKQFDALIGSVKQIVSSKCKSKKTDWTKVTMFLCLVTGRRTVEILSGYSEFTKVSDYEVLFKGHAKDKSETEREPYVIPTLVEADYVVDAINWLKNFGKLDYPTDTSSMGLVEHRKQLNNRVSKALSQAIKLVNPDFTMHDLRKVYANTCRCFLYDKDNNPATENAYVATILGHGQAVDNEFIVDFNTTLSYSIYRVTGYTR